MTEFLNVLETISPTGTGEDAATITIEGTGGIGTDRYLAGQRHVWRFASMKVVVLVEQI
jgi:hypothetical protein